MISAAIFWFEKNLLLFQFISVLISGALLFFAFYFIVRTNLIGEKLEHFIDVLGSRDFSKRRTLKAWKQIQKRLKAGDANQLKLAVLEADRILHEVLRMAGYQEKNLDEIFGRLTEAQLSNIAEIQQVHKLRHRIANEPDFYLTENEARMAIEIYKKAFQEMKLIRD